MWEWFPSAAECVHSTIKGHPKGKIPYYIPQ